MAEFDAALFEALLMANAEDGQAALNRLLDGEPSFSASYLRERQRMLSDPLSWAKRKGCPRWKRGLRTAACIFLSISIALGALMGISPTVRAAVLRWFREIQDFYITYHTSENTSREDFIGCWFPSNLPEGWKLEDVQESDTDSMQRYGNGTDWFLFRTALPTSATYTKAMKSVSMAQNRQQVTVQGYSADYYGDYNTSLLVWENNDGILFWWSASGLSQAELLSIAETIRFVEPMETDLLFTVDWVPEGASQMEINSGRTLYEEVWAKDGLAFTISCSSFPLPTPDHPAEKIMVKGVPACFWDAALPETPTADDRPMNRPIELEDGSSITVTQVKKGTIHNTPVLSWEQDGVYFRVLAPLGQQTIIKIAESVNRTRK